MKTIVGILVTGEASREVLETACELGYAIVRHNLVSLTGERRDRANQKPRLGFAEISY